MTLYTLIFAFDPDGNVLLRKKTHPTVQEGAWNGLGGHCKDSDRKRDARPAWVHCAQRKFAEETGVVVPFERFKGPIKVDYPEAVLVVTWVDLTAEEAPHCYHAEDDVDASYLDDDVEFNRWHDEDQINDMANWDDDPMVESTWEYLELIKSFRSHWEKGA